MEALVKYKKGDGFLELQDVEKPQIGDNEVLIEIKAAAICGTDLHIYHDQFPYWPPVTLGHEFSGIIVEKGKNVSNWKIGDRVVGEPHTLACGTCYYCRTGNIQNCNSKRSPGWGIDGCFTKYMRYPEPKLLHKLPDSVSFEEGSLIEPLANVVTDVIERGNIHAGDNVVVIGPGPIGLMACMVAKAVGAGKVFLLGTDEDEAIRAPLAKKAGYIDLFINSMKEDAQEIIKKHTNDLGADFVIEASGSQGGIASAIAVARKYATIVGIGLPVRDTINFPYLPAMKKVLTLVFNMSTAYTSWDRSINLVASKKLDLNPLISDVVPLSKWEESFKKLEAKQGIKIVFSFN